jgi:L-ascorbate metabolism protein UlaG (beta-lactamase superfamily)
MNVTRSTFLGGLTALGAAAALPVRPAAAANVSLAMRWYGGGVYELATPDDATIVLVDAWIWNNTGFARFGTTKPPELSSAANYVAYLKARNPKSIVVLLTHDHGDHAGDYIELLKALSDAGLPVKTAGHAELMRSAFVPKFKDAGIDPLKLVVNNGQGMNFGGAAAAPGVGLRLVPAVHSTAAGAPAAGFIIDVGGTRVYASGDTDEFGDMAFIGKRYRPVLGVYSAGGGPYTMNPEDAADAARMMGVKYAIPVHYAHNPLVIGPEAGDRFKVALAKLATGIGTTIFTPGMRAMLSLPAAT